VFGIFLFDLPGTTNTKGVLTTLKAMDFIFLPLLPPFGSRKHFGLCKAFYNFRTDGGNKI
jgi:hypothetical protein